MKKGLSQTLYLVIVAVVLLILALVLLTIFGGSMTTVSSLTEAGNLCRTQAMASCAATNNMPYNWNMNTVNVGGVPKSCSSITTVPQNCALYAPIST